MEAVQDFFTFEKVIGIICFIVGITYFQFFLRKINILEVAKGEDKLLQLTEVAAVYWFRLFPILFFGDLLFGIPEDAAERLWTGVDTIFGIISLTYGGIEVSKNVGKDKKSDKPSPPSDSSTDNFV